VINRRKQYNNGEKEKQLNKYKLNKELSEQTFIKVNKTINNWKRYFKGLIKDNSK
jgi:hypothetical protein